MQESIQNPCEAKAKKYEGDQDEEGNILETYNFRESKNLKILESLRTELLKLWNVFLEVVKT